MTDLKFMRNMSYLTVVFKVFDRFDKSASLALSVDFCGCEKTSQCDFVNEVGKKGKNKQIFDC